MIWKKWAASKQDEFSPDDKTPGRAFHHVDQLLHQETRIAALEADLKAIAKDMLLHLEETESAVFGFYPSLKRLMETLRGIVNNHEDQNIEK